MAEQDLHSAGMQTAKVGDRLAEARRAAGLSLGDLAVRTRIAERHLAALEEGRFSDLASRAYVVGFARTYARAVGLDENAIVQAVREEISSRDDAEYTQKAAVFEPGDPARVPGFSLTALSLLGAFLVIVAIFFFWRSYFFPSVDLPDLIQDDPPPAAAPVPVATAAPAPETPPAGGPVVFTAMAPDIWVKFYDGSGRQLLQKQLAMGESYTVPAEAQGPQIWTARPEALRITIGGKPVPPLSDKQGMVKDVPVSASALLARQPAAPVPAASPVAARPAKVERRVPASAGVSGAVAPAEPAVASVPPAVGEPSTVSE